MLRLINSSTETDFVFTIDNHLLEVISTDFVPIKPFKNESLHISIGKTVPGTSSHILINACAGQRYSVIVEANPSTPAQANGNYWIRTISSKGCGNITDNKPESGVIRYDPKSTTLPTSTQHEGLNLNCTDVPLDSMVPIVPWAVDTQALVDSHSHFLRAFLSVKLFTYSMRSNSPVTARVPDFKITLLPSRSLLTPGIT